MGKQIAPDDADVRGQPRIVGRQRSTWSCTVAAAHIDLMICRR